MRIGFLGLGHLGTPLARNLLGPEHTVTVYNRTPGKASSLVDLGAKEAASVADAVKNAEVVITCLANDAAVKEVVHGPAGLLRNLPPKAIHLCMSTIGVETSAALASAHAKANQGYVAALVFGKASAAATRHIWIVAGGPEPQVNRCLPIFVALGRGHTRVGPNAPLAHALKLGGNTLMLAMELAVSEILIYANQAGLPPADYLRILNTAVFRSHLVDDYGVTTAGPSFDPADQTLELAANELLLQSAKDLGQAIPVADQLNARLQAAGARGWGEQDLAELSEICQVETEVEATPAPKRKPPAPSQPDAAVPTPAPPKSKKPEAPKVDLPLRDEVPPPPVQEVVEEKPERADSNRAGLPDEATSPVEEELVSGFTARDGDIPVELNLDRTSHFELTKGHVWAWSQGKRYGTPWRSLVEVEVTFKHILFLPLKRHILLRPDAVLDLRATFGGGAKALVGEGIELDVGRTTVPRLKELLGI
jgi:3-hydroxyisobutyrate dehydrogenase-like beta-hydroxyacid dehydrogenase